MKANEAPKSKFVYPDKLYARCKDNKTLDMSYAPQNMEAVEYCRTDAFIEKACEFLNKVTQGYAIRELLTGENYEGKIVEDFKNYMEESKV